MNGLKSFALLCALAAPALASGCSPAVDPQEPGDVTATVPEGPAQRRRFSYPTVNGSLVSDASLRGRMTVIAMVATYDTASQAQTRFVKEIFRGYTPRVNAMLLVLEPPQNLPLIQAYASSLELSFPVAIADSATIAGKGPFAGLHSVPSVVILDREGREVWRKLGIVDTRQLRDALDRLGR
jgi:hypothetical protein